MESLGNKVNVVWKLPFRNNIVLSNFLKSVKGVPQGLVLGPV